VSGDGAVVTDRDDCTPHCYVAPRGVDVAVGVDHARSLAHRARQLSDYSIGELACFNVDLAREFRYCLENDRDPTAGRGVSTREPARTTQARENQCALPCAVVWCHQPPDLACTCELTLVAVSS